LTNANGYIAGMNANYTSYDVYPTLFLRPEVKIASGDGTLNNPFKLDI